MKKTLLFALIPLLALAGTITRTIRFDARDLRIEQANGYDVVQMADFITTLEPGKPMMPAAVFNVVIPATATVTDIRVTPLEPEEIPGNWRIHPVQTPVPVSSRTQPPFVPPDPATYSSSEPYPAELVQWSRTGTKSEFRICGFILHPLVYIPAQGKLTLYRKMK
ncbi:MAG: C25 family peptidase propeptide domain-containing protein, partial [candidate division WOR-3 bacterium]